MEGKESGYTKCAATRCNRPFLLRQKLHTGPKDVEICSSQISIFEISPTFTQTLPIHIALIHFPMNKSK